MISQKSHYCPPEGRINTGNKTQHSLLQNFRPLGLYQCNGNDNYDINSDTPDTPFDKFCLVSDARIKEFANLKYHQRYKEPNKPKQSARCEIYLP
jgi:hypothetical protein